MGAETYLKKLSAGQAYAQKSLLAAAMIAIVDEYHSGAEQKEVYSRAMAFLGYCYKCKLNDLYTARLRSDSIKSEVVSEKKKFSVALQPAYKPYSYDRRNQKQCTAVRPMTLAELYEELDYQLGWFAKNQPQKKMGILTNLEILQDRPEQITANLSNSSFLAILKTITEFLLEVIGAKPNDYSVLSQFLFCSSCFFALS